MYWKRAVHVDRYCQVAWECLLSYQLVAPHAAFQFLESLDWLENELWLKTLYVAAIEVHPQRCVDPGAAEMASGDEQAAAVSEAPVSSMSAPTPGAAAAGKEPVQSLIGTAAAGVHTPLVAFNDSTIQHANGGGKSHGGAGGRNSRQEEAQIIQGHVDDAFDRLLRKYKLGNAPHILALAARRAYRRYQWKQALHHCQQLDQLAALTSPAAYCYVSVLTLLGPKRALFKLAHAWVDAHPKSASAVSEIDLVFVLVFKRMFFLCSLFVCDSHADFL